MKVGNLVECIDSKFSSEQKKLIPNLPSKGSIYEVRRVLLTRNGKAIQLFEIENPLIEDTVTGINFEPSFSTKRFVIVDSNSGNMLKEILEQENIECL